MGKSSLVAAAAILAGFCGGLAGEVLFRGADASADGSGAVPDTVRAARFEVVDAQGRPRAVLGRQTDGTPSLNLFDAEGRRRALVSLTADGAPSVQLSDAGRRVRAELKVLPDGGPGLVLYDSNVNMRALLSLGTDEDAQIAMYGADVEKRLVLGDTGKGSNALIIADKGEPRVQIGTLDGGTAAVSLFDGGGALRSMYAVDEKGRPMLSMDDTNGVQREAIGFSTDARPGLWVADDAGKVVWRAP